MEHSTQLQTIILQLWILVGLFAFMVVSNIVCARIGLRQRQEGDQFVELWNRGATDELILLATRTLKEQPHHMNALYFGGKALAARGRVAEAEAYFEILARVEPSLAKDLEEQKAAFHSDDR